MTEREAFESFAVPVDEMRARAIGRLGCLEYASRYLHAAQDLRRKHGRRAAYRREWLSAAWFFRAFARQATSPAAPAPLATETTTNFLVSSSGQKLTTLDTPAADPSDIVARLNAERDIYPETLHGDAAAEITRLREQVAQADIELHGWVDRERGLREQVAALTIERNEHKAMREKGWSLAECPACGTSMSAPCLEQVARLERERDDAVATLRAIGEETGPPHGDRTVTLANVRRLLGERDTELQHCAYLRVDLDELNTILNERDATIARLRETVGFFASVIKSGEPWTETCQRRYDAARGSQS
jgi:hypothetical protein